MPKSNTITENPTKNYNQTLADDSVKWIKRTVRSKSVEKVFSKSRVRSNTIYALLIASIFFALLNVIMTFSVIRKKDIGHLNTLFFEKILTHLNSGEFDPLWFSSFVLLTLTCSLALVTIVRKDRSNAQLLSKLQMTNKQLEDKVLKRTSELADAIRAKDHFLGIATHDLKAPLSGILGLIQLLKMGKKNVTENEAEYLAHIEHAGKKMQRLIQDILEINRIDQGKVMVKKEKVDVAYIINELRRNFTLAAAKKNIRLIIENATAIIETDADSLTRILENLLSNAIKFSSPGKKVWMNVRLEKDHVRFEVIDEGPGIPLHEQPRLFDKFQRLSNRPTNSEISTGLGLSIVKELTLQIGGEITFNSEVGKGTTFVVTLPIPTEKSASENEMNKHRVNYPW
jgi:signal transduction histidine kinase